MPHSAASSSWDLVGCIAHLRGGRFTASVDLQQPTAGLHGIACDSEGLPRFRLLAVHIPGPSAELDERLTESYVRGTDLVATYAETESFRVRRQCYWRSLDSGVELVLSVQTSLLLSRPSLTVRTCFDDSEVSQLSADSATFRRVAPTSSTPPLPTADSPSRAAISCGGASDRGRADCGQLLNINNGRGDARAFIVRPRTHPRLSYLEMVYPTDFVKADVSCHENEGVLEYQLFPDTLEKGVIRRARLRALWLPRCDDESLAREKYEQFATSALPLTV